VIHRQKRQLWPQLLLSLVRWTGWNRRARGKKTTKVNSESAKENGCIPGPRLFCVKLVLTLPSSSSSSTSPPCTHPARDQTQGRWNQPRARGGTPPLKGATAPLEADVYNAGLYPVAQHGDPRDGRLDVGGEGADQMSLCDQAAIYAVMELDGASEAFGVYVCTMPAYCLWVSMVIREMAHLNTAIKTMNVRRHVAHMPGPVRSFLLREAAEQQSRLLSASRAQRIISQGLQTMAMEGMTSTWRGSTEKNFDQEAQGASTWQR